jgi:hypothetical protein
MYFQSTFSCILRTVQVQEHNRIRAKLFLRIRSKIKIYKMLVYNLPHDVMQCFESVPIEINSGLVNSIFLDVVVCCKTI